MAAAGEIEPMPVAAIFADTKAEPKAVYDWLAWLEKQLPFPVVRVTHGSLRRHLKRPYWSKVNERMTIKGFPAFVRQPDGSQGLMSRQCTRDFKLDPLSKATTALMREYGTKRAVQWIGISLDEIFRMKPHTRRNTVENRWPLIEKRLRRHDCLLWMQRKGLPKPPRSACVFCPYHSNAEWRDLSPAEFASAARFEREVQEAHRKIEMKGVPFLHRKMIPLDQVDLSTDEERGQGEMFNNDCEGMCGV